MVFYCIKTICTFLYGYETCSVILRGRLGYWRVCLNLKIYELTLEWKNRVIFLYCTHNIVRVIKQGKMRWLGCGKISTNFLFLSMKCRDYLKVWYRWEGNIKWLLEKQVVKIWNALHWVRVRFDGGLLWTQWWTFGFHNSGNFLISWVMWSVPQSNLAFMYVQIFRSVCAKSQRSWWWVGWPMDAV
jgi:hypothetical protein